MIRLATAFSLAAIACPAQAVEITLDLSLSGDVQRLTTQYECDGDPATRTVDYVNADPNFLAVMEIEGTPRIFVNTLSGSGVRYASGQYVWWTSGAEAMFIDETAGPEAEPVSCIELTEIP